MNWWRKHYGTRILANITSGLLAEAREDLLNGMTSRIVGVYGLITFGTITAWWIPYFGGGYWVHGNKAGFEEYQNTHSFLPPRGDNVVPNTLHVILHIQVWICFGLSLYWLCTGGWNL